MNRLPTRLSIEVALSLYVIVTSIISRCKFYDIPLLGPPGRKLHVFSCSELSRNVGGTESAEQGFPCLPRKLSHQWTVRQFSLKPIIRERAKPVPASKLRHRTLFTLGKPKAVYAVTLSVCRPHQPAFGARAANGRKVRSAATRLSKMLQNA